MLKMAALHFCSRLANYTRNFKQSHCDLPTLSSLLNYLNQIAERFPATYRGMAELKMFLFAKLKIE